MNPLGLLMIVFIAMAVVTVAVTVLLFAMKDEKKKKFLVYIMGILAVYIAWANAQSSPLPEYLNEALLGWGIGVVGAAGLVLQIFAKNGKQNLWAKVLVMGSVIAGMAELFFH